MEVLVGTVEKEARASLGLPDRAGKTYCVFCGSEIKIMIFRGTGVCSEEHAKLRRKNEEGSV